MKKKKLDALCDIERFSISIPSVIQSGSPVHALVTGPSTLLHVSADVDKPTNEVSRCINETIRSLKRHAAIEQTS
jgi:hypothetical protein